MPGLDRDKRMAKPSGAVKALEATIGSELGASDWFAFSQREVDVFAALTDDWDFMHNDPQWASSSQWGSTIVHGLLTLSLIPRFIKEASDLPIVSDSIEDGFTLNYGFDRVRFISPFPVASRARGHVEVLDVTPRPPDGHLVRFRITVRTEANPDRPVMVAEHLCFIQQQPTRSAHDDD